MSSLSLNRLYLYRHSPVQGRSLCLSGLLAVDPYLAQATTGKLAGITGRDQGGGQPTHWTIPGHMDRRDEIRGAFALIDGALALQLGDLAIWTCIEGFYPTEFS